MCKFRIELGDITTNKCIAKNLLCFTLRINSGFQECMLFIKVSPGDYTSCLSCTCIVAKVWKLELKIGAHVILPLELLWRVCNLAKVSHLQLFLPQVRGEQVLSAFGFSFLKGLCSNHDCVYLLLNTQNSVVQL